MMRTSIGVARAIVAMMSVVDIDSAGELVCTAFGFVCVSGFSQEMAELDGRKHLFVLCWSYIFISGDFSETKMIICSAICALYECIGEWPINSQLYMSGGTLCVLIGRPSETSQPSLASSETL